MSLDILYPITYLMVIVILISGKHIGQFPVFACWLAWGLAASIAYLLDIHLWWEVQVPGGTLLTVLAATESVLLLSDHRHPDLTRPLWGMALCTGIAVASFAWSGPSMLDPGYHSAAQAIRQITRAVCGMGIAVVGLMTWHIPLKPSPWRHRNAVHGGLLAIHLLARMVIDLCRWDSENLHAAAMVFQVVLFSAWAYALRRRQQVVALVGT